MTIQIAKIEVVAIEETIQLTIDFEGELYRYRTIVYDNSKIKFVKEIQFLDQYAKPLKNSCKKKIRKYIEDYFENESE
jgi:hypothetical protein